MESENILIRDSKAISYEDCHELWEDENTLVHKDRSERIINEVSAHICNVCELEENDVLLNIGCGDGLFDGAISKKVKKMYCVDFSKQKLNIAKGKWGNSVEYMQHDFLSDYPPILREAGINKIYSYEVMQYCNPIDVEKFLLNQLKLCRDKREYTIAHIDVPDKSKAINYYKRIDQGINEKAVIDEVRTLFGDGSYWHDMNAIRQIAKVYDIAVEFRDAHYWDYRTDIIFRFQGCRI